MDDPVTAGCVDVLVVEDDVAATGVDPGALDRQAGEVQGYDVDASAA